MAKFFPVVPGYWTYAKRRGWDEATRTLGVYLLTCTHRNLEGFYCLPMAYASEDLGWSANKIRKAMANLIADGFVEYDAEASVVLLPGALNHHQPKTTPQLKGALAQLEDLPATDLQARFVDLAREKCEPLYRALTEGLPA